MSKGGRPFDLRPISSVSLIGHNAPSLATLMHRGVRFKKMTSKRSKATPSVAATTLTQAFKVNPQLIPVIPISTYTYTILSGCIDHNRNVIGNFALYQTLLFLINFRNIPFAFILNSQNLTSCSSKPAHQQGSKVFNHRVPMPPNQQPGKLNPREKPLQAPRLNGNGRKQHHPLHLIRCPKFKQTRPMHLNRPSIHLIKARHRPLSVSKQPSLPLKVKYQS